MATSLDVVFIGLSPGTLVLMVLCRRGAKV
ncbi:hypothetical protein DFO53_2088 [Enterobacter sp. AG5470]|nr:hypothetical protein DFO53_2088 [Enterobacter sp. AG5470]